MKENKIGKAHGKIILMGEHAVVYGEPSIALPFPAVEMLATVRENEGPLRIDCSYYHGIADEMPEILQSLKKAIKVALDSLDKPYENLSISIESAIPPERGMGSSAAVAVAVTRAIYQYYQTELSHEKLLELVSIAERIAHGNPSGLDAITTSGSSPVYYRKGHDFVPFDLQMDAYLVVGDTGVTGQTKEAVQSIADRIQQEDQPISLNKIHTLGSLADHARTFLEKNDAVSLGKTMDHAHQLLVELGVSNKELDTLVKAAKKAGALGAKLTGGGRGGCMIALVANEADTFALQKTLREAGAVATWVTSLKKEESR
ncbi:MAG TPA: mevalonate kinase [Candidatus Jeotgalibaca pullicola]|nr:mevalonate kinase [Candidatus Jeotgalibaca pullicola]